ncbi:MAG: DNA polymerase III subunit alpha [Bacillota bacterium]
MLASLFLETAYSFRGSSISLKRLIEKARSLNLDTLVLTDRRMHGVRQFVHACKSNDITPIVGVQIDAAPFFKDVPLKLIAYAQNEQGYKNLLKLATLNSIGATIELNQIKEHLEGVSLMLNTLEGEMKALEDASQTQAIKSVLHELRNLTDAFYIGIRPEDDSEENHVMPLDRVAYLEKDDYEVHKALSSIHEMEPLLKEEEPGYLKDENVLKKLYQSPEKVERFLKRHVFTLPDEQANLPDFKTPEGVNSERYLRALAHKGLMKRISGKPLNKDKYVQRLNKELSVIHSLGYDDYFLIVWDVIKYAKKEKILVGPGRGSAPGSLVSYALGITTIDPIRHGLLFERFLNKARLNMPDIDIDFPDDKRDQLIQYVRKRYGNHYVSLICTFGTFLSKSSIRDTARVFEIRKPLVEEVVKATAKYSSIAEMIEQDPNVQNRMDYDDTVSLWLDAAKKIEGLPRHVSTHAAGVMLSDKPLIEYTALQEGLNGVYQSQYEQKDLEAMGLLKMDFLGLRNLTMIEHILKDIEKNHGRNINPYTLPLDDTLTYKLMREKSMTGLFQLESGGMRSLIKRLQPTKFEDIAMALALYRPGPMESIPVFLKRRQGKEKTESLSAEIDAILKPTEGILLYQEQIMAIASRFAGYSLSEADILRRAVSKKDRNTLEKERRNFIEKAVNNDKDKTLANKIYDYIVRFADYGFNKSHSVAYGLISYWMAYLKAHYPAEFLMELMHTAVSNANQMRLYMQEALDLGLSIKRPDIAISGVRFKRKGKVLYYPLTAIKNLGKNNAETIVRIREETGGFTSFTDFIRKTTDTLNKRHYEYLIYSGALDDFAKNQRTMLDNLEAIIAFAKYETAIDSDDFILRESPSDAFETLRKNERLSLGLNIEYDQLKPYETLIDNKDIHLPKDIPSLPQNRHITLLAILGRVKEIKTKKGDPMAFLTLEDRVSNVDAVLFPNVFNTINVTLNEGDVMLFTGSLRKKADSLQLIIEKITFPSV